MVEKSDKNNVETVSVGTKLSRFGLASLIIAVTAIPFYYVSIHRINSLNKNHPDVCVVRDTPFYNTIHTLCAVLPAASVTCAILSLLRCRRSKSRFTAAIPALAGLLLAVASFTIYVLALLALAYDQYH
jgi:hypothetical protein